MAIFTASIQSKYRINFDLLGRT